MASMRRKQVAALGTLFLFSVFWGRRGKARAEEGRQQFSRIAEIEVDPQQLEPYKAALREGIGAAVRLEPGVITLYAVSLRDHPQQIRVFEVYASPAAYQSHLQTPHFKKYKATTQSMVRSLKLIETDPVALGSKSGLGN